MPFGVRGVRPEKQDRKARNEIHVSNAFRREGRSPRRCNRNVPDGHLESPMPFGVRGVRPSKYWTWKFLVWDNVSNAFRREGRSPQDNEVRDTKERKTPVSNAFRREGRSPLCCRILRSERVSKTVSNAFRREGRSPLRVRCIKGHRVDRGSPMPFGVRGVRPVPEKQSGDYSKCPGLQCLSA